MCGIAGLLGISVSDDSLVSAMAARLVHRGPDSFGSWIDTDHGIALSHRRLSILELSDAGHQPMISHCGRLVMSFNGEIYNHEDLRRDLASDGHTFAWQGHSDSETLLACVSAWGFEPTLRRLVGMFAIAVYDRRSHLLHLAVDRMGEKPLYFGWGEEGFAFASELKAFDPLPGFSRETCRKSLHEFASFGFIAAPLTIYRDRFKLQPGCHMTVSAEAAQAHPDTTPAVPYFAKGVTISRYWDLSEVAREGIGDQLQDRDEAERLIHEQLRQTVRQQAHADVKVGCFLSGGVDSLIITALLNEAVPERLHTFTLGVEGHPIDESKAARAVADHFGTIHHELMATAQDAAAIVPSLAGIYDEPFADASQVPTMLLTRLASEHVTVALSGDGGDELFGGYDRYVAAADLWPRIARAPYFLRRIAGQAVILGDPLAVRLAKHSKRGSRMQGRIAKLGSILRDARRPADLYEPIMRLWPTAGRDSIISSDRRFFERPGDDLDIVQAMMMADQENFLPGDILCKVDRAAMAHSLETRVPLLDHRIVELAWRLPSDWKADGKTSKELLRSIARQYVPASFADRPKGGFTIPVGSYLRGEMRDWAESLLQPANLALHFDPEPIVRRWREHLSGERDWTQSIWAILMFERWRQAEQDQQASESVLSRAAG